MSGHEIVNVKTVESLAREGNVDAAAKALHEMPLGERSAVAKQIQMDETSKSDPSLPKLEFTNDGDLKTADVQFKEGPVVRIEFNATTANEKSREYKDDDGSVHHGEFEYVGGQRKLVSVDITRPDGTEAFRELNKATGKLEYVAAKSH